MDHVHVGSYQLMPQVGFVAEPLRIQLLSKSLDIEFLRYID
jgi:hypothetical protein